MLRYSALIALVLAAAPAHAQQYMNASEARSFVVGKLYSYVCFEGTRGAGRINDNGSVAGTIQFRGNGQTRYAVLPANTLRVVGDKICASVKGVPFEPCFNLVKTSANSFRGSVSGLGFAYCDFTRGDNRPMIASANPSAPQSIQPPARSRVRSQARNVSSDAAVQTGSTAIKPVEAKELPAPQAAAPEVAKEPAKDKPADDALELRSSTQ